MLFNSMSFLIFFPAVLAVYFLLPASLWQGGARRYWLLVASYYFYMSWNPRYALLMAFSTLVTYVSGLALAALGPDAPAGRRKLVVAASFIINIGILIGFKYFDFLLDNVNAALGVFGIQAVEKPFDVILPVGISFYTFQALSYTVDVYRGDVQAERNVFNYALFVSFFPQLVAGPIERSGNLLKQLNTVPQTVKLDYRRITNGLTIMLWGFFLKMVIADRLAVMVDRIFGEYYLYQSTALVAAAVGFAFQIYCDFASYSTIAIGAAQVMGFTLMENFNTPYFAVSIKDFWRRWHISLSTWFRDYLYIPMGGNRCPKLRQKFNLMVTFLVSGLWHGASWNYVACEDRERQLPAGTDSRNVYSDGYRLGVFPGGDPGGRGQISAQHRDAGGLVVLHGRLLVYLGYGPGGHGGAFVRAFLPVSHGSGAVPVKAPAGRLSGGAVPVVQVDGAAYASVRYADLRRVRHRCDPDPVSVFPVLGRRKTIENRDIFPPGGEDPRVSGACHRDRRDRRTYFKYQRALL